tara:strand:- start:86 stop:517 length:432 start_codon:yes stop_codon:yes gene_type:complete
MVTKKYILFFFLIVLNTLYANYAFKKKVKSVCSSYRIKVESSQFQLEPNEFSINLESGRNDFEMYMLVGFASAGQAISHQKQLGLSNAYTPKNIIVSVSVPISKGDFNTFIASCESEVAISLANGALDSSEFMQNIMKNMEIQ